MNERVLCPSCGHPAERETPDSPMCLPSTCDAWVVEARFDHETRTWVHPRMHDRLAEVRRAVPPKETT